MERAVALKKLGKILGKSFGYRVDQDAPGRDARAEAQAELPEANAAKKSLSERLDVRRRAILDADPEYQELMAAYAEARKRCDKLLGTTGHYRFTVGTSNSIFFHVKAQGDSWEEVIAKLTTEKQAA